MKYLTTGLILILASADASKSFRNLPEIFQFHQLQQNPSPKSKYQDIILAIQDDDRFFPKTFRMNEMNKWVLPPDAHMLLQTNLESFKNAMGDSEDGRLKRMKTSLSIDNPLDVLRQQYYRALARRMKVQSIEKNREHLIKTGKRSAILNLSDSSSRPILQKPTQRDFTEINLGENEKLLMADRNEQNLATERYRSRLEDMSYQTQASQK